MDAVSSSYHEPTMSRPEYYVANVAFPPSTPRVRRKQTNEFILLFLLFSFVAVIHADLTAQGVVYSFFSTISSMNDGLRWTYQRVGGKLPDEAVVSSLWQDSIYVFLLASSHWWCSYPRLLAFIMLSFTVSFSHCVPLFVASHRLRRKSASEYWKYTKIFGQNENS